MEEKIVFLGNGQEWCEKSLSDFKEFKNVKVINYKYLCNLNKILNFFAKIHFSYKVNSVINLPFKSLWFKKIINEINEKKEEDIIIIIYDRSLFANNIKFIKYLRKNFSRCKLVYMFTNIVKISGASDNDFVSKLNEMYDLVYAFDPADAKKYNFCYSPLIYSYNKVNVESKNQIFYVGRAKDRYQMLINVYERIKELNINSKFYISDVSTEKQKYKNEIEYNKYISYNECLKNIQESTCLLDIIQGDSEGFTIKTCEAIYYDKLLITTNKNVKNAPFYDERYILVIDSANDINEDFFKNSGRAKYSNEGKEFFSVNTYLKRLYKDLQIKADYKGDQ